MAGSYIDQSSERGDSYWRRRSSCRIRIVFCRFASTPGVGSTVARIRQRANAIRELHLHDIGGEWPACFRWMSGVAKAGMVGFEVDIWRDVKDDVTVTVAEMVDDCYFDISVVIHT